MNVAIYGGSFDPPHVAHLLTASYVLATGGFQRLFVVPVFEHAFEKPLAPFEHRVAMCRLCFAGLRDVDVLDVEAELPRPSYTARTLERLADEHSDWHLRFVLGSDALADTSKWHDYERVTRLAPPFVVTRRGYERPGGGPAVLPEVSSTRIRSLIANRSAPPESIQELSALVPRSVLAYIERNALYR
jgi:nicotinate-nucleotide adenylyltransferase